MGRRVNRNRNYARGAAFERQFLTDIGAGEHHLHAIRSAGSHGALDIIEIQKGPQGLSAWGYQLKCGQKKPQLTTSERIYLRFLMKSGMNIRVVWKEVRTTSVRKGSRHTFLVGPDGLVPTTTTSIPNQKSRQLSKSQQPPSRASLSSTMRL